LDAGEELGGKGDGPSPSCRGEKAEKGRRESNEGKKEKAVWLVLAEGSTHPKKKRKRIERGNELHPPRHDWAEIERKEGKRFVAR